MSRREQFIADRLREEPKLSRREAMNHHHSIRHTYRPTRRRGISPLMMIILILSLMMAIATLNRGAEEAKTTATDRASPHWQQMLSIATTMSNGEWGAELLDSCFVLMEDFAESGEVSASRYMLLLANGVEPSSESDRLIDDIAADEVEAETYRLALAASHQNMLRLSESSAPAQGAP